MSIAIQKWPAQIALTRELCVERSNVYGPQLQDRSAIDATWSAEIARRLREADEEILMTLAQDVVREELRARFAR